MIKVLNISSPKMNDKHNYYGGAAGNMVYNLLYSLTKFDELEIHTLSEGVDIAKSVPDNLKLHIIGEEKIPPLVVRQMRGAKRVFKKEKNISVVTYLYFHEPRFTPMLKLVKKYPFIIGPCELSHPLLEDEVNGLLKHRMFKALGKQIVYPLFKKTLEYCDALIVVNEGAKEFYGRFVEKDKITIVPYGVDLARFKYVSLPRNRNILAVSRLIKRRGLDYLIEAMPRILNEYPDTCLHFAGEGPRREILQRRAKELGVISNVTFHGRVSPEELVSLYRNCSVFCHLSFADGWNQPALEAMATGRPTICTNAPHNSMVEDGNTGFLIPWGNSDILAEKIIYLFGHYSLAEKMGMEGRKKVEREYNWDRIAEEYYKVFCEVAR